MSTGRRAYDLLRGYVGREYERLAGVERISAEQEIEETMRTTKGFTHTESVAQVQSPIEPVDQKAHAARILGVSVQASFEEVRTTFDRLSKRSNPTNFPEGSAERQQAAVIQRRVYWAFHILSEDVDATEKRFRSLEIE